MYDFTAQDGTELSFTEGTLLYILERKYPGYAAHQTYVLRGEMRCMDVPSLMCQAVISIKLTMMPV
jgi:hypothetical protein